MDLKSYAVLRKLTANSKLLEYVMERNPVPVDILEDDLHDLIATMKEPSVEQIVNDYPTYLRENVRLGFQIRGKNDFDVNGNIDEPVIESIEMLHKVDREDVVRDLITGMVSDLNSGREVVVTELDLKESVDDFVRMTTQPMFPEPEVVKQAPTVDPVPAPAPVEAVVVPAVDTYVEPVEIPDSVDDVVDDIDISDIDLDDMSSEAVVDVIPDDVPEPMTNQVDMGFLSEGLPADTDEYVPPLFEEPEGEEYGDDELNEVENPYKVAYDYLVDQLREKEIDKRLGGLHLA